MASTHHHTQEFQTEYQSYMQDVPLPSRLRENYTVQNCLKEKGDKAVYVLADKDGHKVVLKCGRDTQAAHLKQEYQLCLHLQEEKGMTMPTVLDCFDEEDTCYLLTTYVEGMNLVQYQERYAPLSDNDIIAITYKVARIIKMLHQDNPPIIHRDIKPENFIINELTNMVYLVDFDTGRHFQPDKERDTQFIGTFSHAAPEQFGFSQSDVRTDVYGLGKTMLYLMSGDANADVNSLDEYAKELRRIVSKSTEFDPEKRYPDIEQFIKDLKRYQRQKKQISISAAGLSAALTFFVGLTLGYGIAALRQPAASMQKAPANTSEQTPAEGNSQDIAGNDENTQDFAASGDDTQDMAATGDNTQETGAADDKRTDTSTSDLQELASAAKEYDPLTHKDELDKILIDCYNSDRDAFVRDIEAFMLALKNDEILNGVEVPEYDFPNGDPENLAYYSNISPTFRLRTFLTYKDSFAYRHVGSFEDYGAFLFKSFNSVLNDKNSILYLYSHGMLEEWGETHAVGWCQGDVVMDIIQTVEEIDRLREGE